MIYDAHADRSMSLVTYQDSLAFGVGYNLKAARYQHLIFIFNTSTTRGLELGVLANVENGFRSALNG